MKATFFAAALLASASTLALADTPIAANTGWYDDQIDGVDTPTLNSAWTFSLAAGETGAFRVTDCCILGDTYKLWSGGVGGTLLATSSVYAGAQTTYGSGFYESLWQDGNYSKIEYVFSGAGNYAFTISGDGAGGLPAGLGVQLEVTAIPEPSTWALMLVGLGVAGSVARRRAGTAKA